MLQCNTVSDVVCLINSEINLDIYHKNRVNYLTPICRAKRCEY